MKKCITCLFLAGSLFCVSSLAVYADLDTGKTSYSAKETSMVISTRRIFSDYLNWQRIFALETLTGAQDTAKAQARMQKSQDDISAMFGAYYGDYTGTQLTNLFNQYIGFISDYANAAKNNGDKAMVTNRIHDKIDEISGLLSTSNMNWTSTDISNMFKKFSDSFLSEIDLEGSGVGSINSTLFDSTYDQAMQMADTFSSGIIKQFPSKFW